MRTNSERFFRIPVIFVSILLVGISYFLYYQFKTPISVKNNNPSTAPTSSVSDNWSNYKNDKYKFSIDYPGGWRVSEGPDDQAMYLVGTDSSISFWLPGSDPENLNVEILKTENIKVGNKPTVFKFFNATVTGVYSAYSYEESRYPIKLITFELYSYTDEELSIVKSILSSYKTI